MDFLKKLASDAFSSNMTFAQRAAKQTFSDYDSMDPKVLEEMSGKGYSSPDREEYDSFVTDKKVSRFHNSAQRERYAPMIEEAKRYAKTHGVENIDGVLESILAQESSWGTNKASYNPKIGKSAWMVGMTKDAGKWLREKGADADLDTEQGALNAAATYFGMRRNVMSYDPKTDTQRVDEEATRKYMSDPSLAYAERYGPGDPKLADAFREKYDYYANNK